MDWLGITAGVLIVAALVFNGLLLWGMHIAEREESRRELDE